MNNFFNAPSKKNLIIIVRPPDVEMSMLKRLGKPKFWVSNSDFFEVMDKIYRKASSSALEKYNHQAFHMDKNQN